MKRYFSFQWHITDDCDQRCKHCYIYSGHCDKKIESMDWEQIVTTFYNCLDFCQEYDRLPYFYITGGDPILHPDFWKLLHLLKEHEIPFTILGNPFHLNDEVCCKLKKYGCQKYQLSLDGSKETHDWFRKTGSYDCTLEKIECLNRNGIRSVIMTTVSKVNKDEIPALIDEVVRAKANVFAFARYVPSGNEVDSSMTAQEYRDVLMACDQKFEEWKKKGTKTFFNKKDHLWTLFDYEQGKIALPERSDMISGGCNCGNCHLTILPTGEVYACRRVADSKVGNVLEDRLADLWITTMESYRDYDRFEKCSRCRLLSLCRGCPAVAKGVNGSFYARDPQCWADENSELFEKGSER